MVARRATREPGRADAAKANGGHPNDAATRGKIAWILQMEPCGNGPIGLVELTLDRHTITSNGSPAAAESPENGPARRADAETAAWETR